MRQIDIDINFVEGSTSRVTSIEPNSIGGIALSCSDESLDMFISDQDALILAIEIIRCHKIIQKRTKSLEKWLSTMCKEINRNPGV